MGSRDNYLYALNHNGTKKWVFKTGDDIDSSCPVIGDDGTIYVGSEDHNLYAINPDGTQKWVFETGGAINSSPAIGDDGTVYIGSDDGKLYAIYGESTGIDHDAPWPMFNHDLSHTGRKYCPKF